MTVGPVKVPKDEGPFDVPKDLRARLSSLENWRTSFMRGGEPIARIERDVAQLQDEIRTQQIADRDLELQLQQLRAKIQELEDRLDRATAETNRV